MHIIDDATAARTLLEVADSDECVHWEFVARDHQAALSMGDVFVANAFDETQGAW